MLPDVSDLVGDVSDVPMKDFEKIINQQVDKKALKGMSLKNNKNIKILLKKHSQKNESNETAMGLKAQEDDPDEEIAKLEEPDEERDIKFKVQMVLIQEFLKQKKIGLMIKTL